MDSIPDPGITVPESKHTTDRATRHPSRPLLNHHIVFSLEWLDRIESTSGRNSFWEVRQANLVMDWLWTSQLIWSHAIRSGAWGSGNERLQKSLEGLGQLQWALCQGINRKALLKLGGLNPSIKWMVPKLRIRITYAGFNFQNWWHTSDQLSHRLGGWDTNISIFWSYRGSSKVHTDNSGNHCYSLLMLKRQSLWLFIMSPKST